MIKGIIFDLGSTLMYFDGKWSDVDNLANTSLVAFLKAQGIAVAENFQEQFLLDRRRHWQGAEDHGTEARTEEALRDTLFQMGVFSTDGLLPRAIENYFAEFEKRWRAYPDAIETLQTLRARGMRVGLISNADDVGTVHRLCANLGFTPFLDPLISSAAEPRWRKPDPRIFHLVADAWQLAPSEIAMVGDAARYDVLGAHRAGMRGILIDRGDNAPWQKIPDELANDPHIQPDATVANLAQVLDVIDAL
jgi:putative hydrolase of the HAD superfamily